MHQPAPGPSFSSSELPASSNTQVSLPLFPCVSHTQTRGPGGRNRTLDTHAEIAPGRLLPPVPQHQSCPGTCMGRRGLHRREGPQVRKPGTSAGWLVPVVTVPSLLSLSLPATTSDSQMPTSPPQAGRGGQLLDCPGTQTWALEDGQRALLAPSTPCSGGPDWPAYPSVLDHRHRPLESLLVEVSVSPRQK